MENEQKDEIAMRYLTYVGNSYKKLMKRMKAFCDDKGYVWDEDVLADTFLKVHDRIEKKGIEDSSDEGFENYTFMAFRQNIKREALYARVKKRSEADDIHTLYERYFNSTKTSSTEKIQGDLFQDFSLIYIIMKVEKNFDNDHLYLFKLKHLCGMTYKELSEKTKIPNARKKVLTVMHWLKKNVTKKEIEKKFDEAYGYLIS